MVKPVSTIHDQRYRDSEQKIQQAIEKLQSEKPLSEITVEKICLLARVTRGTFYRHYANMGEAMEAHSRAIIDEFSSLLTRLPKNASFEALFYLIFVHFRTHNKLYSHLLLNWNFFYFYRIAKFLQPVISQRWLEIQPKLAVQTRKQLFEIFTFELVQELKIWCFDEKLAEEKIVFYVRRLTNLVERLPRRQFDASLPAIF